MRAFIDATGTASEPSAALAQRLGACLSRARQAHPAFEVADTTFARHLGSHCGELEDLSRLAVEDLYVACACAEQDDAALRALHEQWIPGLSRALRRLALADDEIDDVRLAIVQRLVVDRPPKIASYAGRGSLTQWLAAVAAREALAVKRTAARRRGLLDAASQAIVPDDAELGFLKEHYRAHFKEAFGAALAGLPAPDRTVLRHRFVDALTLDQLAAALGVHRATAARRLARIRATLLDTTRAALGETLGVRGAEVDSVVRLIASNFEVSVRRLLT